MDVNIYVPKHEHIVPADALVPWRYICCSILQVFALAMSIYKIVAPPVSGFRQSPGMAPQRYAPLLRSDASLRTLYSSRHHPPHERGSAYDEYNAGQASDGVSEARGHANFLNCDASGSKLCGASAIISPYTSITTGANL